MFLRGDGIHKTRTAGFTVAVTQQGPADTYISAQSELVHTLPRSRRRIRFRAVRWSGRSAAAASSHARTWFVPISVMPCAVADVGMPRHRVGHGDGNARHDDKRGYAVP